LVTGQELDQLLAIETAVAVPDELDRNRVDPRMTGVLAGGQRGKGARVRARQIPPDVGNLGRDEMEVIEEPVGGEHDVASVADIVGQRAIRAPQHADVVLEARIRVPCPPARVGIDGESSRQGERTLLEPLDAQELVAQRLLGRRCATAV
jgi:hypothetical protein